MLVKGASIIVDDVKNLQTAKRTPEDKQSEKFSSGELKIKKLTKMSPMGHIACLQNQIHIVP